MSRSWRLPCYSLYLAPDALHWARYQRFPTRRTLDRGSIALLPDEPARLAEVLGRLEGTIPVADLVLSDAYLLYLVEPWPRAITSSSELNLYLRARFTERYGAAATNIRMVVRQHRRRLLACAWPSPHQQAVGMSFRQARRPQPVIRPLMPTLLDALPRGTARDGWLMSQEMGWVSVTGWKDGQCRLLQGLNTGPSGAQPALEQRLPQWAAQTGIALSSQGTSTVHLWQSPASLVAPSIPHVTGSAASLSARRLPVVLQR